MNAIYLVRVSSPAGFSAGSPSRSFDERLIEDLRDDLTRRHGASCRIFPEALNPDFAFHPERQQVYSTAVLQRLAQWARGGSRTWLGVAEADLYIPILQFVFGEAQMGQSCAVISSHRLRQQFYGLPPDRSLLRERVFKEAVHELGHTFGLKHCEDYSCVMAPSHAVEWMDLKESRYCRACESLLRSPAIAS